MSRLLVHTHVVLWWLADHRRNSATVDQRLRDPYTEPVVSIASVWETAIKMALGKLSAPVDLPQQLTDRGFTILTVDLEHAWAVRGLPHHHGDPFDRMLVAQALVEDVPIATADPRFAAYGVRVVW
ncbi:MAG: type II toxin-antitoxin system VapC family toxin [Solirubrobacteraceae bacterium MAG38_C4-C5]|nr:type II toxin-antitoxin system VapC family toxin [Candidatus Siliceabacter maunaloa]